MMVDGGIGDMRGSGDGGFLSGSGAAAARRAPDDSDVGWGERPSEASDSDRRYLEDRPPHWGSD